MKKFIAQILVVILLVSICTISLSAFDSADSNTQVVLNPIQMFFLRHSVTNQDVSEVEAAKEVLRRIGYTEGVIQALPTDKLLGFLDLRQIVSKETYVCILPDGNIISSSQAQYEQEQASLPEISPLSTGTSEPTTNSWAKLTTYVGQSNSDRTQYSYSCLCEWLTIPFWRMEDYIAIGVTRGSISPDSVLSILTYAESDMATGKTTTKYEVKTGQNEIATEGTTAHAYFNLPNNTAMITANGTIGGLSCSGFSMMLFIEGTMSNGPYTDPMNVSSAYFHQKIKVVGNVELTAGPSGAGLSFSIAPSRHFNNIQNELEWVHSM